MFGRAPDKRKAIAQIHADDRVAENDGDDDGPNEQDRARERKRNLVVIEAFD